MKIQIHLDSKGYDKKPSGKELGTISRRITKNVSEISIREFAEAVGRNGQAFTRAIFHSGERKNSCFQSQQLFAIDVDEGMSVAEFKEKCKNYGFFPFLIYKTFSSTETAEKFRAVFFCDTVIVHSEIAAFFNDLLARLFPASDQKCKDLARLFLGGKEIIEFREDEKISLLQIADQFQIREKNNNPKNCKRTIVNLAGKYGIGCNKGIFAIYHRDATEHIPSEKHIQVGSLVIELHDKEILQGIGRTEEFAKTEKVLLKKPHLQVSRAEVEASCKLLRYFKGDDVNHGLKFLLATNLIYIKSGKEIFFSCLKEGKEKWELDWKRIKSYSYHPQLCRNAGCPYISECGANSLYEKLSKNVRRTGRKTYVSLEEAYGKLQEFFTEALQESEEGIYLIKAQTAIGKTAMYCDAARAQPSQPFMFVVPTIKLQEQVYEALQQRGIKVYKTESSFAVAKKLHLGILEEIQGLYDAGCGQLVKRDIRKYLEENRDVLGDEIMKQFEESLELLSKLDGNCCVVTTHKLFLHLPQRILKQYTVVVDEDIIMSVMKENHEVPMELIHEMMCSPDISEIDKARLEAISEMPPKTVKKSGQDWNGQIMHDVVKYAKVYGLLNAPVCYMSEDRKTVRYFKPFSLPKVKMIILSATLNDKIYRDFCPHRKVSIRAAPEAKYKGRLVQYTYYSMSRRCIADKGREVIARAVARLTGLNEHQTISFKSFDEDKDIYYGKTEGFNDYSGKDIVVLGTPHYAEWVYKMIGAYLGYDTSGSLANRRVERNGFSFNIMTYGNPFMQNLQLFFLESEIEQAVGRARLLRNVCTVYLFSNFPVGQAEIDQKDYLS